MVRSRQTLGWACALFVLNALICHELFLIEYTAHLGSIEAAYIGISRYAIEHPFEWDWFPLWYGGAPYHNTYPPLLHLTVALVAWLFGISAALSHHAVTATLYALGPVALYLLALALSGRQAPSLIGALCFSLLSPSQPLAGQLKTWVPSARNPARLQSLVEFGDGPHVAAVTLIPLALLALHYALERRTPFRVYAAAVTFAAVALTNWLGAFALALAAAGYLLARWDEPGRFRNLLWAGLIAAIAYGLAAPWIPPSAVSDVRHNAERVGGNYPMTSRHAVYAAVIAAAAIGLWMLLRRRGTGLALRLGSFLTFFFGALVLSDDWFDIQLMPQPHRYHLELEMALCMAFPFAAAALLRDLPRPWLRGVAGGFVGVLLVLQVPRYVRDAGRMIEPIEMEQTIDYQASVWLGEHFPDSRVFISGSIQFWLNAFNDTQQLGGGYAQGVVNRQIPAVHYGIPYTTGNGEETAMWLRLYGNDAVVVSGPEGRDFYRVVWRDPGKLDGVLPELWRDGGDAIYAVPRRSRSLAHVILPEHAPYRPAENTLDVAAVEPLARALEDPSLPLASFEWTTPSEILIRSEMSPEQLLFVQVSHHPGWRASVQGEARLVRKDATGQMIVQPRCDGPCEVRLTFDGGLEMLYARLLCLATALLGLVWMGKAFLPAARGLR